MAATWEHPELGTFTHDDVAWVKTIDVPAFEAFTYGKGNRKANRPTAAHEVAFESDSKTNLPSDDAVELMSTVLAHQHDLVTKVTRALWDDFNGRGPRSGMWWRDDLDAVRDGAEDSDVPSLDGPDDLLGWMRLWQIAVRTGDWKAGKLLVEFSFHAAFEEEHGVGVLTDGQSIVGLGYSCDAGLFKSK